MSDATAITPDQLLFHWQGHRRCTRRVIEAFPADQLFTFSIGGMRPFGVLVNEMLGIGGPMLREVVQGGGAGFSEDGPQTKDELLAAWDANTVVIDTLFPQLPAGRFGETMTVFGQYTAPLWDLIMYGIDNEIHHRGQGYVYLRALGIEPPPFFER
jgi:uncharacterized damage-inducible protein DinB